MKPAAPISQSAPVPKVTNNMTDASVAENKYNIYWIRKSGIQKSPEKPVEKKTLGAPRKDKKNKNDEEKKW